MTTIPDTTPPATSLPLPESLISTLPGRYYTDPAIFELEQEKIFE
ncbi:MAG: aromatic ring-hydroxylating dioxygenase subunit alpha, partial [Rhodococcus sp.]|nr:aromatic ring-hydroxylating dioxygenase subunit alpha [Rhodococcus sp. (in: high G+C Gram-positive bacteria)]